MAVRTIITEGDLQNLRSFITGGNTRFAASIISNSLRTINTFLKTTFDAEGIRSLEQQKASLVQLQKQIPTAPAAPVITPRSRLVPVLTTTNIRMGVGAIPRNFPQSSQEDFLDMFSKTKEAGELLLWQTNWRDENKLNNNSVIPQYIQLIGNNQQTYGYDPILGINFYESSGVNATATLNLRDTAERNNFKRVALEIVTTYNPRYLILGVETNTFYLNRRDEFPLFLSLYKETYDAIKAIAPDTQVFTTFQLEQMKGIASKAWPLNTRPQWELINAFGRKLDLVAFTTYPQIIYNLPSEIPNNYYLDIKSHIPRNRPVAFTESGWSSDKETILNARQFTEQEQRDFLARFIDTTTLLNPVFIVWSFLHDIQQIGQADSPFSSLGLRKNDGTPKLAWSLWTQLRNKHLATAPAPPPGSTTVSRRSPLPPPGPPAPPAQPADELFFVGGPGFVTREELPPSPVIRQIGRAEGLRMLRERDARDRLAAAASAPPPVSLAIPAAPMFREPSTPQGRHPSALKTDILGAEARIANLLDRVRAKAIAGPELSHIRDSLQRILADLEAELGVAGFTPVEAKELQQRLRSDRNRLDDIVREFVSPAPAAAAERDAMAKLDALEQVVRNQQTTIAEVERNISGIVTEARDKTGIPRVPSIEAGAERLRLLAEQILFGFEKPPREIEQEIAQTNEADVVIDTASRVLRQKDEKEYLRSLMDVIRMIELDAELTKDVELRDLKQLREELDQSIRLLNTEPLVVVIESVVAEIVAMTDARLIEGAVLRSWGSTLMDHLVVLDSAGRATTAQRDRIRSLQETVESRFLGSRLVGMTIASEPKERMEVFPRVEPEPKAPETKVVVEARLPGELGPSVSIFFPEAPPITGLPEVEELIDKVLQRTPVDLEFLSGPELQELPDGGKGMEIDFGFSGGAEAQPGGIIDIFDQGRLADPELGATSPVLRSAIESVIPLVAREEVKADPGIALGGFRAFRLAEPGGINQFSAAEQLEAGASESFFQPIFAPGGAPAFEPQPSFAAPTFEPPPGEEPGAAVSPLPFVNPRIQAILDRLRMLG